LPIPLISTNEQSPLILTDHTERKKATTFDNENPGHLCTLSYADYATGCALDNHHPIT